MVCCLMSRRSAVVFNFQHYARPISLTKSRKYLNTNENGSKVLFIYVLSPCDTNQYPLRMGRGNNFGKMHSKVNNR